MTDEQRQKSIMELAEELSATNELRKAARIRMECVRLELRRIDYAHRELCDKFHELRSELEAMICS